MILGDFELFKDPVMTKDGNTFERILVEKWFETMDVSPLFNAPLLSKNLVPNITLKKLIQELIEEEYKKHLSGQEFKSVTPLENRIPKSCFCPLSHCLFVDPVTTDDGHTYERAAIEKWFQESRISPITGLPLTSTKLLRNHALRNSIELILQSFDRSLGVSAYGSVESCVLHNSEKVFSPKIKEHLAMAIDFDFEKEETVDGTSDFMLLETRKRRVKEAEQGDARASYYLGNTYADGDNVTKPIPQIAEQYYQQAVEKGYAPAQAQLGIMYYEGRDGVAKNINEALRLFRLAADQGNLEAWNYLGIMHYYGHGVERNYHQAVECFKTASRSITAKINLGFMFQNGYGVDQNRAKVLELFQEANILKIAASLNNLGEMFMNGHVVKQDNQEAVRLFTLAAAPGDLRAQTNLGLMFLEGRGVDKDYEKAVTLFILASANGNPDAEYYLGIMYEHGYYFKELNYFKAGEYYENAVKRGHVGAHFRLAKLIIAEVYDSDVNPIELLQFAAKHGNADAQFTL